MNAIRNLIATLLLLGPATQALPHPSETSTTAELAKATPWIGIAAVTSTDTATSVSITPTTTAPPSLIASSSSASSFTGHCDYSFCNSGSKVCFYWAGYTSWDVSRGPIPGEIPTILGPC